MIIVVDSTTCLDGSEDLLSLPKIPSGLDSGLRKNHRMIQDDACDRAPAGLFVADLFKSQTRLEAEKLFLRHQLNLALRRAPPRLRLRSGDRAMLLWMTRLWPSLLGAAQVIQPAATGVPRAARTQFAMPLITC